MKIFSPLYLAAVLLTFSSGLALAETQHIRVMGVDLDATDIELIDGNIHRFTPTKPITFTLSRGNSVLVSDTAYLHPNGNLALVISPTEQKLSWKLNDGRVVGLDCGARYTVGLGRTSRMITFYDNLEYKSGCSTDGAIEFKSEVISLKVYGDLDVGPLFNLLYAQKVESGDVLLGDSRVRLAAQTSVAFFPNGRVRFATIAEGESFKINHPVYGQIRVAQKTGKGAAFVFSENGTLQKGILGQDLTHKESGVQMPAGTGIIFSDTDSEIVDVLFPQPSSFQAGTYMLSISRFGVDQKSSVYNVILAEGFAYTAPGSIEIVFVPRNSLVVLDFNRQIVGILIAK